MLTHQVGRVTSPIVFKEAVYVVKVRLSKESVETYGKACVLQCHPHNCDPRYVDHKLAGMLDQPIVTPRNNPPPARDWGLRGLDVVDPMNRSPLIEARRLGNSNDPQELR